MNRVLKLSILGILLAVPQSNAMACPLCKLALDPSSGEPMAYMISILFMMGMIMGMFSAVAVLLWWVSRLEKSNLTAAGYEHLFENAVNQTHRQVKS